MIRINLLPREERKRRTVPNISLFVGGGVACVLVVLMVFVWWTLRTQIRALEVRTQNVREEIRRTQEIIKDVEKGLAEKKVLEERLNVIARLEASQKGPVRLLDGISTALPREVWLTNLTTAGSRLTLQGISFTNFGVADFMTNLGKLSPLLKEIELSFTERTAVQKVPLERFEITARSSS